MIFQGIKMLIKKIPSIATARGLFQISSIFSIKTVIIDLAKYALNILMDSRAGLIKKNVILVGIFLIFFAAIAFITIIEHTLRVTLGSQLIKGTKDVATVFLAPQEDKLKMIQRAVQNDYVTILQNINARDVMGKVKNQVIEMNKTFYDKVIETAYATDSRLVWALAISLTLATIALLVKTEMIPNPVEEAKEKVIYPLMERWKIFTEGKIVEKTEKEIIDSALKEAGLTEEASKEVKECFTDIVNQLNGTNYFKKNLTIMDILPSFLAFKESKEEDGSQLLPRELYSGAIDESYNYGDLYLKFKGIKGEANSTNGEIHYKVTLEKTVTPVEATGNVYMLNLGKTSNNLAYKELENTVEELEAIIEAPYKDEKYNEKFEKCKDTLRLRDKNLDVYEEIKVV